MPAINNEGNIRRPCGCNMILSRASLNIAFDRTPSRNRMNRRPPAGAIIL